jgi:nicotinamidase-related amidase
MANTIYLTDVSALILIELLNDFLSPNGKAYSRLAGQFEKVNFIPNVTRLLAGARVAGLQIVYAPHGLNQQELRRRQIHSHTNGVSHGKSHFLGRRIR